eukprot:814870-Pelagomonas_calceolata.AAC.3
MPPLHAPFPRANGTGETTLTGLRPASTRAQPADADSSLHYFQNCTHVEVLGTQGAQPLASWKVTGPSKALQKCTPANNAKERRGKGYTQLYWPARAAELKERRI